MLQYGLQGLYFWIARITAVTGCLSNAGQHGHMIKIYARLAATKESG
jgi:hypothetical protein